MQNKASFLTSIDNVRTDTEFVQCFLPKV